MKVRIIEFSVKVEDAGKAESILMSFPCRFLVAEKGKSIVGYITQEEREREEIEAISFRLFLFPEDVKEMGKIIKESKLNVGPIIAHEGEITIYCPLLRYISNIR